MKKLVQIVIIIQFALMLTHCATSTDDLYSEYAACREQTLIPKVNKLTGIVQVHKDGSVVMVYPTGACPDELAEWEKSHALKEKRRREREAYSAAMSQCGDLILVCSGRGVSKCISRTGELSRNCRCECMRRGTVQRMLGGRGFFVPTGGLQFRSSVSCEKKNF